MLPPPQVYATDKDAGNNGKVRYSIIDDSSRRGFFRIQENTGWIKVAAAMSGVSTSYPTVPCACARAHDRVTVHLDV